MASPPPPARVLSIQSHTVYGYVGNKAAVLPLQLCGVEVDAVNSVQFSNHTGYKGWKGSVMSGEQLWEVVEGMDANGLLGHTHLLTGYIGSASLLETVLRVAARLRELNPRLQYVCDPVMGDNGQMYCPPALLPLFRERVVPSASVVTPNGYEAQLLTGGEVGSDSQALEACRRLHDMGPHTVVITSLTSSDAPEHVTLVASTTLPQGTGSFSPLVVRVPRLDGYFTGAGDLLTALLLAGLHQHPGQLVRAVERAVAGLQGVLAATVEAAGDGLHAQDTNERFRSIELRLVQSQEALRNPAVTIRAQPLNQT